MQGHSEHSSYLCVFFTGNHFLNRLAHVLSRLTRLANYQKKRKRNITYKTRFPQIPFLTLHVKLIAHQRLLRFFFIIFLNLIQIPSCDSSLNVCEYLWCKGKRAQTKTTLKKNHLRPAVNTHNDIVIAQQRLLNPLNIPGAFNQLKRRLLISLHVSWIAY